ncbi:MAG: hypothetical protein ACK5PR_01905, partial [bacterium]
MIKLDGLGNVEWQKTYGGGTQSTLHGDNLHEIDLTRDGGYILAGTSYSPIGNEKSEDRISNALGDYWVVKVDGLGNIEWDEVSGGTGRDWLFSVQEIPGGYILGGMSQSDKGFDKSEDRFVGISGDRRYDIWIVKLCELAQDKPSLGPDFALACSGPPDTLRTDEIAGLDYRWYRVSGPGSETPQAGDAHELEVLNPGTYIVEVENNCGLTARDTVVVSENASPAISGWLPETADLCTGPVQLGPIAFPAIYTVGWQDLGWGGSVPRTVTAPGTYVLRVTTLSAPDCPGYDTVVVSGSSAPIKPSLGPDFTFACPGTAPDTLRTAPI